ncbi:MAG: YkgJ family cysteine cluster protein [Candidatus Lokiarchaeota archaeon]|nr:YkgJ family cysteine cluster protein [Candidatus Lokiarchaeota archaeon]MBD3201621.1 YkgJ family cysteine cluster protein [Candidatus Lokiarchaeota archaeon]
MKSNLDECKRCGLCCLNTEMLLSKNEITVIIDKFPYKITQKEFSTRLNETLYQLINIDGHCFFYDIELGTCEIYDFRPQGCEFYPFIYNQEKQMCEFDSECPNINLFNQDDNKKEILCIKLRKFLREQLKVQIT